MAVASRGVFEALIAGVVAGLAVAVPLGAIGVLVVELGVTSGFRTAWAAGMGVASADLGYGAAAAFAGGALAGVLAPARSEIALVGAGVLTAIALHGLWRAARGRPDDHGPAPRPGGGRTYLRFLALTAVNPLTIAIFAAIVAGLPEVADAGTAARAAFAAGVFAASAAWQSLLAAGGALLGRAAPRARIATSVAGHLIVLALAGRLALGA